MGLYVPNAQTGYAHAGMEELDRKLKQGDGLTWGGDPDLDLHMGVITDKRGNVVARRYEVWRFCEDGQERMLAHWRLEEFDRILLDIVMMKAGAEGKVASAEVRIDTANAKLEKEQSDKFVEKNFDTLDHALRLAHDTTRAKNTFRGIPGQRDKKKVTDAQPDQ